MTTSFLSSSIITELSDALSKAQALIEKADKDKINPHFRSKYSDLGNVVDAIKPAIAQFGLSFIQICHDKEDHAAISTIILHSSGQWIDCGIVSVPIDKKNAQGYGSAMTYARRYSLSSAFGVAPDDDDGNKASEQKNYKSKEIHENKQYVKANIESINILNNLFKELKITAEVIKKGCEMKGCQNLEEMKAADIDLWINSLSQRKTKELGNQMPSTKQNNNISQ